LGLGFKNPTREASYLKSATPELKAGISDEQLAKLVTFLREHDALCVINPEERQDGARIICSMGLFRG
jgi:hypothetical protein